MPKQRNNYDGQDEREDVMSLDSCFDREMESLDEELALGNISQREYNKMVQELEWEAGDYERDQIRRYDL